MRFSVEMLLENEIIPKDKNRIFISLIKNNFESYDNDYYEGLYKEHSNKIKSFTFSVYMPECKFTRDEIVIPNKKLILNFSTYDIKDGIMFYNSFLKNKRKSYPIKNNILKVNRISLNNERSIMEDEAIFKSLSPISVREHNGDNKKTWYHSLNDEKGMEVFLNNLKFQLLNEFGKSRTLDIEEIEYEVIGNKEVKVKNYDIEVLANICKLKIKAKPYILDYLYKAGMGSQRSSGFGMMDLV